MQELTTPFEEHDLVWAKVQHYPWWPGKIVEIFQQKKSLIFKISFYADPTYCYIKQDDIIAFDEYRQQLNANFIIDGQLQRAINLANNAFQRKRNSLQNRKVTSADLQIQPSSQELEIVDEKPQKVLDFEQETIPIDFEADNSNGKTMKIKKATEMKNLLIKYKLDKIPVFPKHAKMFVQQEQLKESHILESSEQDEQKVELFNARNMYRKKSIKKRFKRRTCIKRKYVGPVTNQERKVQFMRRGCTILISKGIQTEKSRQIVVKMVQKAIQGIPKSCDSKTQKMNEQMVYLKLLGIVSEVEEAWTDEQKMVHIFTSVDGILYQMGVAEKEEEEKTNIIYADQEEISVL